jgi:TRAP-type C4-dicarboxylate transport system permease small subunit
MLISKMVHSISRSLAWIAQFPLLLLTLSVLAMIILRRLLISTAGIFEFVVIFAFILYILTWPYTQSRQRNIRVTLLLSRLPTKTRFILQIMGHAVCICACSILVWAFTRYSLAAYSRGDQISFSLPIPIFWVTLLVSLIFLIVAIVFLVNIIDLIVTERRQSGS